MPDSADTPPQAAIERTRLTDPRTMSFGEHLEELRTRLIWALLGIAPIFLATIFWGNTLLEFILTPARAQLRAAGQPGDLIVTGPLEALGAWLKVSGIVTIVLGIPIIVYQLWRFVAPGLYPHERRFAQFLVPLSVVLSLLGLAFLYYVMLPAMLAFLINFGLSIGKQSTTTVPLPQGQALTFRIPVLPGDPPDPPPGAIWFDTERQELRINTAPPVPPPEPGKAPAKAPAAVIRGVPMTTATGIAQQYRVSEYVGLVFTMGIAFAAGFQTPVVVLLLGWVGIFDRKTLARSRKYALFSSFVVAAILTPSPDPFSMTVLAIPLYLLYEFGLFLLKFVPADRVARGLRFRDLTRPAPVREAADAGDE
jgi:sec-independent protein translocase protein TatC